MIYQYMQDWLKALRSGDYRQANEVLKTLDFEGKTYYCCLGIAADHVLKVPNIRHESSRVFDFNFGPSDSRQQSMLSYEAAALLDLHKDVSDSETVSACKFLNKEPGDLMDINMTRQRFLAALNDLAVSFPKIADVIELLGWDKPDRVDLMNHWISELRSGEYEQAFGWLKKVRPEVAYCCLGIVAEKVIGRKFVPLETNGEHQAYLTSISGVKNSSLLHEEDNELLGLDIITTEDEAKQILNILEEKDYIKLQELRLDIRDSSLGSRATTLSILNDNGATFSDIADVIESLEWNK